MALESVALLKRLDAIIYDAEYVRRCAQSLQLPVVGNQRCGTWYVPPDIQAAQCYFKSTDGHVNKWAFNHRRLNLHLLPLIEANAGCIIVDSTKGDKRFSDASSKTIPIWCAVLNRILFPAAEWAHDVVLPSSDTVSSAEAHQIHSVLPSLQADAEKLKLDILALRAQISKPLIPAFLDPPSPSIDTLSADKSHSIVIVMASANHQLSHGIEPSDFPFPGYIRGAGDDEDNWSHSITPAMLWAEEKRLMQALKQPDMDFHSTIEAALKSSSSRAAIKATQVGQTGIYAGNQPRDFLNETLGALRSYDAAIFCESTNDQKEAMATPTKQENLPRLLQLQLPPGKIGSRLLRTALPKVVSFVGALAGPNPKILVVDKDGADLAIGVILVILCIFYQSSSFERQANVEKMDKELIRTRLAMVSASTSDANPSRSTLQSTHAFLMPETGLLGLRENLKSLLGTGCAT